MLACRFQISIPLFGHRALRQPRERITGSAEPMCLRWMTEQWVGEFRTSTSTFRPAMFRLRTNYGVSEVHGGDL